MLANSFNLVLSTKSSYGDANVKPIIINIRNFIF